MNAISGKSVLMLWVFSCSAFAAVDESIIGTLENTDKKGACAQITDSLKETYYIVTTIDTETACKPLIGKKVVVVGLVEDRAGKADYFFQLKRIEVHVPKSEPGDKVLKPAIKTDRPFPEESQGDQKNQSESKVIGKDDSADQKSASKGEEEQKDLEAKGQSNEKEESKK